MRDIAIFTPEVNKEEKIQIDILTGQIWNELIDNFEPVYLDCTETGQLCKVPTFIRHGLKVVKTDSIQVLDTTLEPYFPILNRYLLKLILENIAKEDTPEENDQEEQG